MADWGVVWNRGVISRAGRKSMDLCEREKQQQSGGGTSDHKALREEGSISSPQCQSPPPPTAGWEAQRSFHRNCGKGFLAPEGTSCELDANCFQRLERQR